MITKVQNILRCYAMGMSIKGISSAFELSRNTVRRYVRMFQDSGLSLGTSVNARTSCTGTAR